MDSALRINGTQFYSSSGVWRARIRGGPEPDTEGSAVTYTLLFENGLRHTRKLILKIPLAAVQHPFAQRCILNNIKEWLEGKTGYSVISSPAIRIGDLAD